MGIGVARQRIEPVEPMPSGVRRFALHAWQGKELAFVRALKGYDYSPVSAGQVNVLFALFDLDVNHLLERVKLLHKYGRPLFLYPHSARPMIQWDGMYQPWPHTKCSFVIAEGHAEVMRRYGYPIKTEVVGWPYCRIRRFSPVDKVRKILFGPIHPNVNGFLSDVDMSINRGTFQRLLDYCLYSGASLVVRHIHSLEQNGIERMDSVKYIQAVPNGSISEIDDADVVVGHQTFAYMAVARGKPTLMMGESIPPRSGNTADSLQYVRSWEKYADLLSYPHDILTGPNTVENVSDLILAASKQNRKATTWRDRFIGEQFFPDYFVERLESYL